jgi:hypothetical protein
MSQPAANAQPRGTTWIADFTCFRQFFPARAMPAAGREAEQTGCPA